MDSQKLALTSEQDVINSLSSSSTNDLLIELKKRRGILTGKRQIFSDSERNGDNLCFRTDHVLYDAPGELDQVTGAILTLLSKRINLISESADKRYSVQRIDEIISQATEFCNLHKTTNLQINNTQPKKLTKSRLKKFCSFFKKNNLSS